MTRQECIEHMQAWADYYEMQARKYAPASGEDWDKFQRLSCEAYAEICASSALAYRRHIARLEDS